MSDLSLFERILYEAPGDDPPADTGTDNPPTDNGVEDPPDIGTEDELSADDGGGDPPDIGMDDDGNPQDDDLFGGDDTDGNDNGDDEEEPLHLDDKVSAIMNMNLYQRFLSMLNTISNQINSVKDNSDMLYTLSPESLDIVSALKKLDENIHIYLKNNFTNENYSKNLLFFNKCLNLLKLLNDSFDSNIRKGIKSSNN